MNKAFYLSLLFLAALPKPVFGAGETPASFTLDGTLYDSPSGTTTLLDAAVRIRVQILPPAGSCVLYDEEQTVNTAASDGAFSIQVGSAVGAPRRVAGSDVGNSMSAVFQNRTVIAGQACTYTPAAGDVRRARLIISPTVGSPDTLSPDMVISSVPSALVADTLQGVPRTGFLQLGAGSLTQTNVENVFSSSNYPTLTSLLAGTGASSSGSYAINAGTGGSGGINFNINGSTRVSISNAGNFDIDSGSFFVDAAANRVGIGTTAPAASLDLGAKTDAMILPTGTTGQRPSPASAGMLRFNSGNGKLEFHNGTAWADLGSDISGITAGGDLSGTYPNPGVARIRGQAVSANASAAGQVLRYDGTNYTPGFVAMSDLRSRSTGAAALSTSCTAAQTLTWNSVSDTLSCTAIGGLNASAITAGTIATARLPASASAWTENSGDVHRASGNVGIGDSNPYRPLTVAGSVSQSDIITVKNTAADGYSSINFSEMNGGDITSFGYANGSAGLGWARNNAFTWLGGSANYYIGNDSQALVAIENGGKVGIGTASPAAALHVTSSGSDPAFQVDVNGNQVWVDASGRLSTTQSIRSTAFSIDHIYEAAADYDRFMLASNANYDPATNTVDLTAGANYDRAGITFLNGGSIAFMAEAADRSASPVVPYSTWKSMAKMTIQPDGNVGIGTAAPTAPLHVASSSSARISLQKIGDHTSEIYDDGDMHITSNNRKLWVNAYSSGALVLNLGGGNVGIGNRTSPAYKLDVDGDLRITGIPYRAGGDIAWTVPSDERLKDVKGSYEHGLDAISKLRTVRFHYKEGNAVQASTEPEYIGVIAQEVRKVIPEAVSVNPKNGFLNLNSSPIFWSLVNATKELKERGDALAAANATRDRDHAELRAKAQRLEAENGALKAYLCAKDPSAPFCSK